jgi:hypothetical protein
MNPKTLTGVFLIAYTLAWLCGVINQIIMIRYFKAEHPDIAKNAFPSLLNKSIRSDIQGFRYIVRRGYTEISDHSFIVRMDLHRHIQLTSISIVAIGIIVAAVYFSMLHVQS